MLKKSYNILRIFAKEPWKSFTFKDIKRLSGSRSESYVYNILKQFVKENVLIQAEAGNVLLYKPNSSSKAIIYLALASEHESWNKKNIPYADLEVLMSKLHTRSFTFLITGSYASGKQRKDSDIDIIIICNDTKKAYAELRHISEMNIPKIHLYVFTEDEFMQMLLDKKPNFGKEAVKNNIILSGGEAYYRIVMEAVAHGFNG